MRQSILSKTDSPLIVCEHVSCTYGNAPVVEDVYLTINRGEFVGIVGPSGSGKSTLLKMVNRMVGHDGGRILWKGEEIERLNVQDLRRRMGYAIQSVGLFPHRTVADNIATVPRLLGWHADRIQARTGELLIQLGLEPAQFADRYPHQLSGGQQQRLCIARSLAVSPQVLLMDEPCSALDPGSTLRIEETIRELANTMSIVIVTHNMQQAARVSDYTGFFLSDGGPGRLIESSTTVEIFTNPKEKRTEDYVSGRFG